MRLSVYVPIATVPPNRRASNPYARNRAVQAERAAVHLAWVDAKNRQHWKVTLPCVVTLTRISPGELDDDAPQNALKACRDQVAVELGLPLQKRERSRAAAVAQDKDPRVTWRYGGQEKGPAGVRIEVEPRAGFVLRDEAASVTIPPELYMRLQRNAGRRGGNVKLENLWAGDFGTEYTARNQVDWRTRLPFWRDAMEKTNATRVLEVGCNRGHNLRAIRVADPTVIVEGCDVNDTARREAAKLGIFTRHAISSQLPYASETFDLSFTAGVLIHVSNEGATSDLCASLLEIARVSSRWVLAVEYEAEEETPVPYRDLEVAALWRRNYGRLYQEVCGLKLVEKWDAGSSFDRCVAWLMSKE